MIYFIDSADAQEIETALQIGARGITANPSMYRKSEVGLMPFLSRWSKIQPDFLSGEVIGSYEEMLRQAEQIHQLDENIVIKINFSQDGLRLAKTLHDNGIRTAMTLLFTLAQANAAINAGCDYLFFFIGRNEEQGHDGLTAIKELQELVREKEYPCRVVAASIKNLYQLEQLIRLHIDCAALPYALYLRSLEHPLSESGAKTFAEDYFGNPQNKR